MLTGDDEEPSRFPKCADCQGYYCKGPDYYGLSEMDACMEENCDGCTWPWEEPGYAEKCEECKTKKCVESDAEDKWWEEHDLTIND